ncbi:polysaccharide deacetylase family protein [Nocardioides sp.]|uniref:polysaccharide deacetylase family protein n=1 Tax=Nocardioides sp. TaxID=35761 RepID=UPI0037847375
MGADVRPPSNSPALRPLRLASPADTPADWLGEKISAVAVLSFALDGPTPILSSGRRYADHAMTMSHQSFESEVAVPRLLQLLADVDVAATFFVPGAVAESHPAMVASVVEAGHEVAHHSYSHRPPIGLSLEQDREEFERGLAALGRLDIAPRGYRAPMWAATYDTPDLVAEYGMTYDSSLMNRDSPYRLETGSDPIVELPPHWSLDDWEQYAYLPEPHLGYHINRPEFVVDGWLDELSAMRTVGGLFMLTSHAFLTGRAGRAVALRRLIETAQSLSDVRFVTAARLADEVSASGTKELYRLERVAADPDTFSVW